MIIKGGKAGSVGFWSTHLLRTDTNERAVIRETRGVIADDLPGALREMQAVASASRCGENFMYQANINPLAHEKLTPEQWDQAIDRLEKNLGFQGHARVVIEHVKEGRQHMHVIWNRVDDDLRTVNPFMNYLTHERTARELEREFGLERLVENGRARATIQLWEQQKGEQTRIDPHEVKAEVTQLWRATSSGQEFLEALEERGYILAKGDRRDFCIVDHAGTVHSLARRIEGVKAADVRERMADVDRDGLPTVAEARATQRELHHDPGEDWANRSNGRDNERDILGGAFEPGERPPRRDALDLLAGALLGPVAKVAESLGDLLVGGGEQMTPRQAERAAIREAERKEARAESEMVARLEKSLRATEAEIDRRGGNVSGEHLGDEQRRKIEDAISNSIAHDRHRTRDPRERDDHERDR